MHTKKSTLSYLIFLLPLIPILIQYLFTRSTLNQIRYEELAESIRNVYWYRQHLVYDNLSHNIGWYASLNWFYQLMPFSLFSAKYYRFFISIISNFSLLLIFRKFFTPKQILLPFLAYSLSPTLLYFSTLQAQYGIDLQYIPILMCLLVYQNQKLYYRSMFLAFLFGIGVALSFFTYAVFYLYIPFFLLIFIIYSIDQKITKSQFLYRTLCLLIGIALVLAYFWPLLNSSNLFQYYQKLSLNLQFSPYQPNLTGFISNLKLISTDLFIHGNSYNFELFLPDFSLFFPLISILVIVGLNILHYPNHKKYKVIILTIFIISFYLMLYKNGPQSNPGMRRNTIFLIIFYALYSIELYNSYHQKIFSKFSRYFIQIIFLLIPIHHILVIPTNLVHMPNFSQFKYNLWFSQTNESNPQKSIEDLYQQNLVRSINLNCGEVIIRSDNDKCRYQETYAALNLYCEYHRQNCHPINGFDPISQSDIPITTNLFSTFYWPH